MKTAFIFPGLNGLIKAEDRMRYLHVPEVSLRLKQVEAIFKSVTRTEFKFENYLQGTMQEIYAIENISKAATAICAIQVGVSENLMNKGIKPDWTLGCSLGDLGRAVISHVVNFETCITGYIRFAEKLQGIEKIGANVGVSKPAGAAFTQEEITEIENLGLDISVMTPNFLNIGGRYQDLEMLQTIAKEKRFRTVKILDYPAHSRYISNYVQAAALEVKDIQLQAPSNRIFSCISCDEIIDTDIMKNELMLNMTQPLRWGEAIQKLESYENEMRFINIGPCKSLTKMIPDLHLKSPVYEADVF